MSDPQARFLTQPPIEVKKTAFLKQLEEIQQKDEISWLITNKRSFGWSEINQEKPKFVKELQSTKFETACVGVFNPNTKETKYSSYKITNH